MVRADGTRLTHEQVIKQLETDTVSTGATLGLGSNFPELLRVALKLEVAQYATGIAWLRDLLYSAEFDIER